MGLKLHDFFVGNFPISQTFGQNYEWYKWIKDINGNSILGHNGIDYAIPTGNIMLNPFPKGNDVVVTKVGWDEKGYGWYLRMWDKTQNLVMLYAHNKEITVSEGDKLNFQQQVAISNNTGWSTGAHSHIAGYKVDSLGNKLNRDNGYDGWLNILDGRTFNYEILNPSQASAGESKTMEILVKDFEKLMGNSLDRDTLCEYLGFPKDTPVETLKNAIAGIKSRATDMENRATKAETEVGNRIEQIGRKEGEIAEIQKLLIVAEATVLNCSKTSDKLITEYKGQLESKQGELNDYAKKLGLANIALAEALAKRDYFSVIKFGDLEIIKWK